MPAPIGPRHRQQPRRSGLGPCQGQIDDDSDVLVTSSGASPDTLIDPDRGDALQPVSVVGAGGQDRIRGGVPTPRLAETRAIDTRSTTTDFTATMIASRDSFPRESTAAVML